MSTPLQTALFKATARVLGQLAWFVPRPHGLQGQPDPCTATPTPTVPHGHGLVTTWVNPSQHLPNRNPSLGQQLGWKMPVLPRWPTPERQGSIPGSLQRKEKRKCQKGKTTENHGHVNGEPVSYCPDPTGSPVTQFPPCSGFSYQLENAFLSWKFPHHPEDVSVFSWHLQPSHLPHRASPSLHLRAFSRVLSTE